MRLAFQGGPLATYSKIYLWSLVDNFELEIEVELAEVGGRSEVEMIGEDNEIISEG